MLREVQVAHRQQMPSLQVGAAAAVGQVIGQTAGLAAGAPVAAARGHRPRQEAAAAVTHADGTVHEALHLGRRGAADRADLVEREVALQNHPGKARLRKEPRPLGRTVAHLRRGVQLDGKVHAPQGHVLHDQGIDPRGNQLPGLTFSLLEFVVPQQGVERGVDAHAIAVCILHGPGDLFGRIAGSLPRPEPRAAHVDGVGTIVHGRHRRGEIPRRSKQLDLSRRYLLHWKTKIKFFPGFCPLSAENRYL